MQFNVFEIPVNIKLDSKLQIIKNNIDKHKEHIFEIENKISELNIKLANINREERLAKAMIVKAKLENTEGGKKLLDMLNGKLLLQ